MDNFKYYKASEICNELEDYYYIDVDGVVWRKDKVEDLVCNDGMDVTWKIWTFLQFVNSNEGPVEPYLLWVSIDYAPSGKLIQLPKDWGVNPKECSRS